MFARQRVGLAEALEVSLPELDRLLVRDGDLSRPGPGRPIDLKQVTLGALVGFRARDRQRGGGVFAAAACMTEMAGWMAYEAGDSEAAERHFGRAHDLASLADDSQLRAHVLASWSHLAAATGSVSRAGVLARSGRAERGRLTDAGIL